MRVRIGGLEPGVRLYPETCRCTCACMTGSIKSRSHGALQLLLHAWDKVLVQSGLCRAPPILLNMLYVASCEHASVAGVDFFYARMSDGTEYRRVVRGLKM
jgi:hypothetical protein